MVKLMMKPEVAEMLSDDGDQEADDLPDGVGNNRQWLL